MNSFLKTIKFDYLQRTRSYAFLITLCISLAIAYTFVPEPNANYSTIRIGDYQGVYNAAWFGYVTAIMTTTFLSLIGFYLINNSIQNDIKTRVGQIVATTKFTNFKYLFSKVISNFLVLLTIAIIVFGMSVVLFFLYNDGSPFKLTSFIKPYVFITFPALFIVSVLAIVFEVFLGKYSILQNMAFFFLFTLSITFLISNDIDYNYDIFGGRIVTVQMENQVNQIVQSDELLGLSIGFSSNKTTKKFDFQGIDFPMLFVLSRMVWVFLGIVLIALIAPVFHRFNVKERLSVKKTVPFLKIEKENKEIMLSNLLKPQTNYGIFPLFKTELLLLIRKGKKWLWLLNILGMVFLATLPVAIAYQIILPILWFFQVGRLADLSTKEVSNNVHYMAFSSYKPLTRLFTAQLLAGIALTVGLAVPLIIRFLFTGNGMAGIAIISGGVFLVLFSSVLGVFTKGKRLFEFLFFMITYANINRVPLLDYFGATTNNLSVILVLIMVFSMLSFLMRKLELSR